METKDTINTAIDIAKTAKAVLPQTTEETDGAISILIGWFNNVVLFPIKKLILRININSNVLKMIYTIK